MPGSLRDLFLAKLKVNDRGLVSGAASTPVAAVQLATAALLIEVSRADHHIADSERHAIGAQLREKFRFSEEELRDLLVVAETRVEASISLYEFTGLLNEHLGKQERAEIVTQLWRIAFADREIDKYEEYTIRKIADLLHVPHRLFIAAKLQTAEEEGNPKP